MAPECFWDVYLPSSDVFSAGILFYRMITGIHPWDYEFEGLEDPEDIVSAISSARKNPACSLSIHRNNTPDILDSAILKSLALNIEDRYLNAEEFLKDLNILFSNSACSQSKPPISTSMTKSVVSTHDETRKYSVRVAGKGFDQIAGMDDLKELLFHDVVRPLQDKELYAQYKLSIPNGMLLYGPPGCGKTFISQKFAEEVGFTFLSIKPSDVASVYVHGTQENIHW